MMGPSDNPGVTLRALSELFRIRDERQPDFEYNFSVSVLEIYNETVRDLLDRYTEKSLQIHQGSSGVYVSDLSEHTVQEQSDVIALLEVALGNRAMAATALTQQSSRSHCVFMVRVEGFNSRLGIKYVGKLQLIDLAGSERVAKSEVVGTAMQEAQNINKSLSMLGDVIQALQNKQKHVPFRNSKLTYLLSDSLGGHSKTAIFCTLSPDSNMTSESLCTLNFANRIRRVNLGAAVASQVRVPSSSSSSSSSSSLFSPLHSPAPSSMSSAVSTPTASHSASAFASPIGTPISTPRTSSMMSSRRSLTSTPRGGLPTTSASSIGKDRTKRS
eukprot:TRINITY_DN2902_c0_g4_i1.p1 TRINITY_DN2902_c0_g4~~TRINITY_DN2902_c0_g4_i1.p1  ORF type:complete len:329 (+),score=88.36 TRINITY_DN2902_c0_g4_i1:466-1452(+)